MNQQHPAVHDLLMQLKDKNFEAAAILYKRYNHQFYLAALHSGLSPEEADDVVQTTFSRLLTGGIATYQEEKKGGATWLWRVATNIIRMQMRKRQRQWRREVSIESLPFDQLLAPQEEEPENVVIEEELYEAAPHSLTDPEVTEAERVSLLSFC